MKHDDIPSEGTIILFRTAKDWVRVELLYQSDTFWMDQKRMAELFGVDFRTISYHLKEIYSSGEHHPDATLQNIWRVPQFRIWATQTLREFIIKGIVVNDLRLRGRSTTHYEWPPIG